MKSKGTLAMLPVVLVVSLALLLPFEPLALGEAPKAPVPDFPSQPLTIQQAISYGLEHNRTLLAARQEVHAASQQVKQARADFFPKLDTHYSVRQLKDKPVVTFFGGAGALTENEIQTSHSTLNRWEVDVTQPLFTGFGVTAQLNVSKMDLEISEHRLEETRLDVVRDIQQAFLRILFAEKLVQVTKDNVESLMVQRHNAEAQFQQGLTPQNDVLKADVALAQARQREREVLKQLLVLQSRLNQLLDLDLQTKLALTEEEVRLRPVPPLDRLCARAERQRPAYLSSDVSIRQADEAIRAARSKYYPQVSAFAQYYREGEDFLANRNEFTNNDNASIGLRVDWNWFEGGKTEASARELIYRQRALEERRRDLRHQIHIQVEEAFEQLAVARANIESAKSALAQAEENERMVGLQYKEQLVIFLEVLNAQVFLLQTRVDYYQAFYGYQIAWAELERAVGGPLQTDGKD